LIVIADKLSSRFSNIIYTTFYFLNKNALILADYSVLIEARSIPHRSRFGVDFLYHTVRKILLCVVVVVLLFLLAANVLEFHGIH